MVLVFIGVIGAISLALLGFNGAITRQSFSTKKVQTRETGANTGLEWAVNELRQGADGFCLDSYNRKIFVIGGREVEVTCKRTGGAGTPGLNTFALYLNNASAQSKIATSGAVGATPVKNIIGPVYNGGTWDLKAPLYVEGDVIVPASPSGCPLAQTSALPANLIPIYNTMKQCTTDLSVVTPAPVLAPCSPLSSCKDPAPQSLDAAGAVTAGAPSCKVFSPGYYTNEPVLAPNNFFKPGVYYFELNKEWRIGNAILGGDPRPAIGSPPVIAAEGVVGSIPKCAGAPAAVAPYGVVFVFGKKGAIHITNNGRMELFSYQNGATALPSIVEGGVAGVTAWANATTVPLSQTMVKVGVAQPEFIAHAGIFAPNSAVELRGSNNAIEAFLNTVVVGRFDMFASASITNSNFGVFVPSGAASKFVLMARSCSGVLNGFTPNACSTLPTGTLEPDLCSVASITVYGDTAKTVWIDNWRVDRVPNTSMDPATCALP